ncbi:SipW-dependent-type signal peptide-containing protein [Halobaculum lipolyticum]|uniref:SipW-dependent-type signal peptide-containing protein n=1 Tax=Halobaculum lipolyticum TaxID=3032001 RepID=A0ABD5WCH9_9EURY|nr:SipW-dependent-type signal peptide-containing protein [Halobaculum sp. DT31]
MTDNRHTSDTGPSDGRGARVGRRNVLLGLGTIGLASAGAGLGTTAYFSDTESFSGNTLQAGSLDLTVEYEATYNGGPADNLAPAPAGEVDGEAGLFYTLADVKPGDAGSMTFCFELLTNPAYLWVCADATADDEAGQTEPEVAAEGVDTDGRGELDDAIVASAFYCDAAGEPVDGGTIASGVSLATLLALLSDGAPLNAAGVDAPAGEQSPYEASPEAGATSGPCLCIEWELPTAVGNEVQSDALAFGVAFHALQARHTDGTDNPCAEPTRRELSTGVADWQVTASPDDATGDALVVSPHPAWYDPASDSDADVPADASAEWVNPYGGGGRVSHPTGDYAYELPFVAPLTTSTSAPCTVAGAFASDNGGRLFLDGVEVAAATTAGTDDYRDPGAFAATVTTPGVHTLRATVNNKEGSGENPSAVFVAAFFECP